MKIIINFLYDKIYNNHMLNKILLKFGEIRGNICNFLYELKDKIIRKIPKIKKKINIMIEKFQLFLIKIIKFILNIDTGALFIFAVTFMFIPSVDWRYRLIGSFGIYYYYNDLKKYFKGR